MRRNFPEANVAWLSNFTGLRRTVSALLCASLAMFAPQSHGQADVASKVQLLTDALNRAQDQLSQAQRQLQDLRQQMPICACRSTAPIGAPLPPQSSSSCPRKWKR
jgi:hypothetical protein